MWAVTLLINDLLPCYGTSETSIPTLTAMIYPIWALHMERLLTTPIGADYGKSAAAWAEVSPRVSLQSRTCTIPHSRLLIAPWAWKSFYISLSAIVTVIILYISMPTDSGHGSYPLYIILWHNNRTAAVQRVSCHVSLLTATLQRWTLWSEANGGCHPSYNSRCLYIGRLFADFSSSGTQLRVIWRTILREEWDSIIDALQLLPSTVQIHRSHGSKPRQYVCDERQQRLSDCSIKSEQEQ